MKLLLITGGTLDLDMAKDYIESQSYDYILTADGGASYAKQLDLTPNLLLGDFDTLDPTILDFYRKQGVPIVTYPPEKDYTDTHLALEKALEQNPDSITILGGMGTRFDHTLANIGLLTIPLKRGVKAEIVDRHNRIRIIDREWTIRKEQQFGKYISLIPYTEQVSGIELEGFYYPLHDAKLTIGISQGISNELVKEQGKISIKEGLLLVIESHD